MKRPKEWNPNTLLCIAALLLVAAVVWVRPGPAVLYGVDAGCYARVAKELSERPVAEWYRITLSGDEFFEHPPAALWAEALFFRLFDASAETAILYARTLSFLAAVLVFLVAGAVAGWASAAWCVLALLTLSGWLYESQDPMLEIPLSLGLAMACLGTVLLGRRAALGTALFVIGFLWAFWVKGPPALAVLPILGWWTLRKRVSWPVCATAVVAAVALLAASVAAFDGLRGSLGLEPFFGRYLSHQVFPSLTQGRHNPVQSPFYYVRYLWRWYATAVVLVPFSVVAFRKMRGVQAGTCQLLELGWVYALVIAVGFSIPVQKYQWYIHAIFPGAAWFTGATLAVWGQRAVERWRQRVPGAVFALAIAYVTVVFGVPRAVVTKRPELEAIHALPAPAFSPGQARAVAHCGRLGEWRAMHLFAFRWGANLVRCDKKAPFTFNGRELRALTQN